MDFYTALVITIISIAFSAFFSGMEIAFISSNKVRVGLDSKKKGLTNHLINFFYTHQDMFISTLLVGNNIMLVIYGMGMAVLLEPLLELISTNSAFILFAQTIISTCIILITGEFVPKTVFRINPNMSLRHFALPLWIIYYLLYPISWLASLLSKGIMRLFGAKSDTKKSVLLTVGELDDYIQQTIEDMKNEKKNDKYNDDNEDIEHEVKIFQNALDFSTTYLRDCMIPRNEIVGVDIDETDTAALREKFISSGLSKIIVYREDIDNVEGYIHVSELFNSNKDWKTCIRPVQYAPESMLANNMMRKMLADKKSIAVIVDEFGGTSGLVTLEDLVEEIFGDFEDEHDKARFIAEEISEGIYHFSGRIEIEDINDRFDLNIPENDEYQTLAGYILYNLERLPQQGDSFVINDLSFLVLKKTATKIDLVQVSKHLPEEEKDK